MGRPLQRLLLAVPFLFAAHSSLLAQIQDNSFLIEEAYNQERGIVQHISTFSREAGGRAWDYSFTQEWPVGGIRHQLSYTVPLLHGETGTGVGDIALNYRYQLLGHPAARVVLAPRASLLLPSGSHEHGRGSGAIGFQTNLPLSYVLGPRLVSHWNAGATLTPLAQGPFGDVATTFDYNLGASAVWLVRPSINLMLEAVWLSTATVAPGDGTAREEALLLNPGLRGAIDASGLHIVPGVAYTFDLSAGSDNEALFLYLSLEHRFKR